MPRNLSLKLLQLYLSLGQSGGTHHPVSALHILPCHGHCPFQPLHPLMVPSPLLQIQRPGYCRLDTPYRGIFYAHLLVPIRILLGLAQHPYLASPNRIRASISHNHHAAPRADHSLTLGNVHQRPRRIREFPSAPIANHDGRRMPAVAGLYTWRSSIPGCTPFVPPCTAP